MNLSSASFRGAGLALGAVGFLGCSLIGGGEIGDDADGVDGGDDAGPGSGGAASGSGGSEGDDGGPAPGSGGYPDPGGSDSGDGSGGSGEVVGRAACKRGLAYGYHSKADFARISSKVSWWYNWTHRPDEGLRDGSYRAADVEYIPMIWNGSFETQRLIEEIPADAKVLLGFNEPNFGEQANMSAQESAARWPAVEVVADALGLTLVSPAVNFCGGNCRDTDPFHYLDQFFAACRGCRVDKVAFHIYVGCNASGDNKAQWLINHVETYKQRFSQPLWLTEFACSDARNFDEQVAFLRDAVAYLENEPRVEKYAWFSGRFEHMAYVNLFGGDGELTPLGEAYVSAPFHPSCPD